VNTAAAAAGDAKAGQAQASQVSTFFDVGATIENQWMHDDYLEACRAHYLAEEKKCVGAVCVAARADSLVALQAWVSQGARQVYG
jgi:hypothetical protein